MLDSGEIRDQVLREVMALLELRGIVPEEKRPAGLGQGNQDLEWAVDCSAGCGEIDKGSSLRVGEDEQLGWAHGETGCDDFAGVTCTRKSLVPFFRMSDSRRATASIDAIVADGGL